MFKAHGIGAAKRWVLDDNIGNVGVVFYFVAAFCRISWDGVSEMGKVSFEYAYGLGTCAYGGGTDVR